MDLPVFIKRGDATAELGRVLDELRGAGGGADAELGLHKTMYVARADQTVVMVASRETPLAAALRARRGWFEPKDA
jgi:hypothetical protein